jgi:Ca2+-binding RTX toxin-like protein
MSRLRIKDAIVVSVNAKVNIDWHLAASADAALPGVSTDFKLTWAWGASTGTDPGNTSGLKIKFDHVTLDAGEFFGKALKPYLQQIVDATKPLQPIIDTIFTPMPVISDLSKAAGGDDITIATLAEKFNTLAGGPKIKPFLDAIKTVKDLLKGVKCDGVDCGVDIGSFELDPGRTATTSVSAGNASTLIDPAKKAATPGASDAIASKDQSKQLGDPTTGKSKLAGLRSVISFPVIDDPTILFDLISGGDIPLVEFDSGPLTLGFQFQKSFGPIYAPPPVMMVIGGGASVTLRIAAGFDTYGIRRAMETGDGAQVLDSLYFKTVDKNGAPIPVVQFTGYLEAGASVSIGILEVGVVGGIKLTVGFYWNDPNNDGKFRLFEFGAAVANNPICLFNVGGELSLYIKIFVEIGFSPFSVSFDFTLVNIKLLDFNLKPNCTPPPPRLGGTRDGVLYVFAGKFSGGGPRGDSLWDAKGKDETWVVRQVPGYTETVDGVAVTHDPTVDVRGLGITESFPDTTADPITTVVLDGRDYPGSLTVSFSGGQAPVEGEKPGAFTKKAVVFTGSGDDVIRTGEGDSWVDAGAGNDNVVTLDRTNLASAADSVEAHVAGGPGADTITVGNGKDTVTGDGSLRYTTAGRTVALAPVKAGTTTLADPVDVGSVKDPTDDDLFAANPTGSGNDQIAAGLGAVVLSGNGGVDTLGTANDSTLADSAAIKGTPIESHYRGHDSVLVGGAGGDVMKSGSADDKLYTGTRTDIGESGTGGGDASTDVNTVDTGSGSDTVYGSNGIDFVTTHSTTSQAAIVYGGGADDVLTGGQGTDEIYGGPGDDYVVAAPATVGAPGSASDVLGSSRAVGVLPGASTSTKKLVGGTGSDRIYGTDGPSTIFGDTTADACSVQADPVGKQPGESNVAGDAPDLILGGSGVDVVNAGGAGDWVYAAGGDDRVCGNAGGDHLYGGDADDVVYGGSGNDQGYGEAGADQVYGNDDNDALYGGAGADRLQGNNGADWLDGGTEADVVLGGTSQAGKADGADVLLGAAGADVLVGDNAQSDVLADTPYPTDLGSADATLGGNDYLVGGDDPDRSYGGLGDDTMYGGTGDDYAEGNPGTDHSWGEAGDDDLIGGSSQLATGLYAGSEPGRPDAGDFLYGGTGQDVIAGDNASVTRGDAVHPVMAGRDLRTVRGVDLADEGAGSPTGVFGNDHIESGDDIDVVFAQRGDDDVDLGDAADYGEGGPGIDVLHGDNGDDDLVGGSSQLASGQFTGSEPGQPDAGDTLYGGPGQDVIAGDNGLVTRGGAGHPVMAGHVELARDVDLADEDAGALPSASGDDVIQSGDSADVVFGQGGDDQVSLGEADDYGEGGPGADTVNGDSGDDDVVGGSFTPVSGALPRAAGQPDGGDTLAGDAGEDVVLGDNGSLTRPSPVMLLVPFQASPLTVNRVAPRAIAPYDLGDSPVAGTSGPDTVTGGPDRDVLLGQGGNDSADGGSESDYVEGGQGSDLVLGGTEDDDVVGGSSASTTSNSVGEIGQPDGADNVYGGTGSDLVIGDNGLVTRTSDRDWRTTRANADHSDLVPGRGITLYDLDVVGQTAASATHSAGDALSGQAGVDVVLGQGGNDAISGGGDDDYVEGQAGADVIHGDLALSAAEIVAAPAVSAWATPAGDTAGTDGQDDLTGGSSSQGYRDGNDTIHGDGKDDFVVGDNGSIARVLDGAVELLYAERYGSPGDDDAKVRVAGGGATSTRFCPTTGKTATSTCEMA